MSIATKDIERKLLQNGWVLARSSKHKIYKKGDKTVPVKMSPRTSRVVVRALEKQTGLKF